MHWEAIQDRDRFLSRYTRRRRMPALHLMDQVKDESIKDDNAGGDLHQGCDAASQRAREENSSSPRFFEGRTQMEVAGEIGNANAKFPSWKKKCPPPHAQACTKERGFVEEEASLKRSPSPRSLPKRRWGWGRRGEAASLERSASPPRPLLKRLLFQGRLLRSWFRLWVGCVSEQLGASLRRLTEPPRTCGVGGQRIENSPWRDAMAVFSCVRREGTAARERSRSARWQGAAALLSAAVTTTKQQEPAPNSHGREPPEEWTNSFPAALW